MSKPKQTTKPKTLTLDAQKGESKKDALARAIVGPYIRHGIVAADLAKKILGDTQETPQFDDYGNTIKAKAKETLGGDMTLASELLTAQALSLDAMMTELMRRVVMNLGEYPLAAERYARLAFKAQSNSRASLEALAKLHQPREQTVRHVHVNEGGQAVVADNFHHHTGARKMRKRANNPIQPERLAKAPRCLAQTRKGTECQSPAVKGRKRCRMHGGQGSGAAKGNRNAWKHGGRSGETMAAGRYLRELGRLVGERDK